MCSEERNPVGCRGGFPVQGKAAPAGFYWVCAAPAEAWQVEKGSTTSATQIFVTRSMQLA